MNGHKEDEWPQRGTEGWMQAASACEHEHEHAAAKCTSIQAHIQSTHSQIRSLLSRPPYAAYAYGVVNNVLTTNKPLNNVGQAFIQEQGEASAGKAAHHDPTDF
jgi:hypothetical protein